VSRDRTQRVITLALLVLFVVGVASVFGEDLRGLVSGPSLPPTRAAP
jgi:hypothetical protein